MKTVAEQTHETFLTAGWPADIAARAALRARTPDAAQKIVASAAKLPNTIRAIVLRDKRHASAHALVSAFAEAADVAAVIQVCGRSAPLELRSIEGYVSADLDGEHLMSSAEAREKLMAALAEMDQHIDTARPIAAGGQGIVGSMNALADACWAARKGETNK